MDSHFHSVETLAQALDDDDYVTAASVMADNVEYTIGDEKLHGRDAVIDSYRAGSEMARRIFDRVDYSHEVVPTDDPRVFSISYTDALTASGETLTHMVEQIVTVRPGDGVARIRNVDLPGEAEKVDDFMKRHGLSRDG